MRRMQLTAVYQDSDYDDEPTFCIGQTGTEFDDGLDTVELFEVMSERLILKIKMWYESQK